MSACCGHADGHVIRRDLFSGESEIGTGRQNYWRAALTHARPGLEWLAFLMQPYGIRFKIFAHTGHTIAFTPTKREACETSLDMGGGSLRPIVLRRPGNLAERC